MLQRVTPSVSNYMFDFDFVFGQIHPTLTEFHKLLLYNYENMKNTFESELHIYFF